MEQSRRLLVQLDAIVDTRLGTLLKLGMPPEQILGRGLTYWARLADDFEEQSGGKITKEIFQQAYSKRDVETLKVSMMTNALDDITESTRYNSSLRHMGEQIEEVTVTLNYYPYDLDKEQVKLYLEALQRYVSLDTKLNAVSIPHEILTLDYLSDYWDAWYLYEFRDWISAHESNLGRMSKPAFEFIVPGMFYGNEVPGPDKLRDDHGAMIDPFAALAAVFIGTATVVPQPVAVYSAAHPLGTDGILKQLGVVQPSEDKKSS